LVDDFLDNSPTNEMPHEATLESQLTVLPSDNDDDDMSATLQEALSLLERDYEDEFTASQILERDEINRAIEAAEADQSKDNNSSKEEISS
ncbi:MAG: hypothetical protein QGH93_04070, partial [Gammaproteobacteria bacterium]|nr:hypothetical protein [Gammaproteobacteria bacterium]